METKFSTLGESGKQYVLQQLEERKAEPHIVEGVKSDKLCAYCWMNWYNCVCGHDDEE